MKKTILTMLAGTLLLASCYNDSFEETYPATGNCDTVNVTYSGQISSIMQSKCAGIGCHGGAAPAANITLTTHQGVKTIADNGKLMGVITHATGFSPMPKGGNKLDDCTIAIVNKWVQAGAPNN